jgi:hypothetical protein
MERAMFNGSTKVSACNAGNPTSIHGISSSSGFRRRRRMMGPKMKVR